MQLFLHGDRVRIADDLGPSMRHFQSGVEAIVTASYADLYGGNCIDSFAVHIEGRGPVAWYNAGQLTMVERGCGAMLAEWRAKERESRAGLSEDSHG